MWALWEKAGLMGVAYVSLFGNFQIGIDGYVFSAGDLGGRKPKELLELLLMARGAPVAKDVLADRLWPDRLPKKVHGTLETYVSGLRKLLFDDREVARRVLQTVPSAYQFHLDAMDVDVIEFDRLLSRADRGGVDSLDFRLQAHRLASGDLLEDAPKAAWAEDDRELYRDRVTRNAVLAADALISQGAYVEALRLAERALSVRGYAEEALRATMLANHGLGQTEISRQVYERFCDQLGDELGRDCTTETADLAGAIDAGATIEELAGAPVQPPVKLTSAAADRRNAPSIPFAGRSSELATVRRTVEWSRNGHSAVVLVRGRPGVGRTSFLEAVRTEVGGTVGIQAMSRDTRERPGLPLAEVIQDALRDSDHSLEAERYAQAPLLSGESAVLRTLCDLLTAAGPTVLLIDDLQWADPATIMALEWLRRNASRLPVTIVATVRDGRPDRHRTLDLLTASTTITLDAPTEKEWRAAGEIDPETIRVTGGLPFLMADCHRWRRAGHSGVSPSLRRLVLELTRGFGVPDQVLLQEAAVLAEPFGPFDFARAHGDSPHAALDGLMRLADMGVIEQVADGFRFRAPIVRDVLAGTVIDGARRSAKVATLQSQAS